MEKRGAKRRYNPNMPKHINQDALPKKCYWDNSGNGHWYTTFIDKSGLTPKQRRKRIAGAGANLSDLHKIMESLKGVNRDTFRFIANEYFKKSNYTELAEETQRGYQICFANICDFQTKADIALADVPLTDWTSPLVQRYIDTLKDTPSSAKHVHSFIRRVFSWGKNRGYCATNPAIGTELPKERKKQTLPTQQAYDRLLAYAKANGTYGQKHKGSCPHYIWAIMEINYLCYLRGIETRNITDEHIKSDALLAERRKGSGTNLIEFNDRLRDAFTYLVECRTAIWSKSSRHIPLKASERPIVVNTFGEPLKSGAYHSSWQRFVNGCIERGVITLEQRFSMHDLKRKGITDTEEDNAGEHLDPRMKDVYDKSIRTVKPASD